MPQVVRRRWRPQPTISWVKQALFVALLILPVDPLPLPVRVAVLRVVQDRQDEFFDNTFLPHRWSWNFTGPNNPQPHTQYLFNVAPVAHWMWNSFWISVLGAALSRSRARCRVRVRLLPLPAAQLPVRRSCSATMMLPGEVTMIPVYLLWNKIGNFTTEHAWLPHIGTGTQYPLWVPNMFGSAFYIFLQRQFFIGIPRDYFEAARIDGDGYFSMFRRIALPLAKPALIVCFIFEVQAKWFDLINAAHLPARPGASFTVPARA